MKTAHYIGVQRYEESCEKMDSQGVSTEFSGQFQKHFRKASTYIYL